MSAAILGAVWLLAALLCWRWHHPLGPWALVVTAIPVLGYLTLHHGPYWGLAAMAAAAAVIALLRKTETVQ